VGESLLRAFVWVFAGPSKAFFLSAPSVALLFAFRYPQLAVQPSWALSAVAPLVAVLTAWRSDGLQWPVRWEAVLTRAAILGVACVATGLVAAGVAVDAVALGMRDPELTWLVISMLSVVVVWLTIAVFSAVVRHRVHSAGTSWSGARGRT
jgi:hypothetical protein